MLKIYIVALAGWALLIACGLALRRRRAGKYLLRAAYAVFLLFCVELACVLAFYVKNGRWTFDEQKVYLRRLFEAHPYMVGAPRRGVSVTFKGKSYTHNSQGFRGRDFPARSARVRVVAMGGSTTYGAGVNDGETWPVYLEEARGPGFEVLNFGALGHGTVEHINQAALLLPEYAPDVLVVHAGLNDLRNMHVRDLAPDYSDFHAPSLYGGLGLCAEEGLQELASVRAGVGLLKRAGLYPLCTFDRISVSEDRSPAAAERALRLYRRNLTTLVRVAGGQGLRPVLVPQVLVRERFEGGQLRWWIPFVADDELIERLGDYNRVTREVADAEGLRFCGEVLEYRWTKDDFADPSHLNAEGNRKLAALIRGAVTDAAPAGGTNSSLKPKG